MPYCDLWLGTVSYIIGATGHRYWLPPWIWTARQGWHSVKEVPVNCIRELNCATGLLCLFPTGLWTSLISPAWICKHYWCIVSTPLLVSWQYKACPRAAIPCTPWLSEYRSTRSLKQKINLVWFSGQPGVSSYQLTVLLRWYITLNSSLGFVPF